MTARTDNDRWLSDLREKAEAFRVAMIESGAVNHVRQDTYFDQLRALECALNPMNYRVPDDATSEPDGMVKSWLGYEEENTD